MLNTKVKSELYRSASGDLGESASERKKALEAAARGGDTDAIVALMSVYEDRLTSLAQGYLKNFHSAQDAVADAFEKAWKSRDNFRGESEVFTWMYRIVVNECKNRLLKDKRNPPPVSLDQMSTRNQISSAGHDISMYDMLERHDSLHSNNSPENMIEVDRIRESVVTSVAGMSDIHREVFMLREVDDMTYAEIADELSVPIGTVRSRLYNAREILAEDLGGFQRGRS